jgi:hypothetical protein
MAYLPGSVVRVEMLKTALKTLKIDNCRNINYVDLSARLSIAFWQQGDGNRVHINPNTTYVTTEDYVNDICQVTLTPGSLIEMFKKEVI